MNNQSVPLLTVTGLHKSYGPVQVLTGIDFDLRRGEVHALVGENGAGKSTLSRIITGLTRFDAGRLELDDVDYLPRDRRDAEERGIRMVLQELNLVSSLTVAENLFINQIPNCLGWIDRNRLHRNAETALARVGLKNLDPSRPIRTLGVGQQQMIEIAAGLARSCRLLILDEPTAALTAPEIDTLLARIKTLCLEGTSVLYISHRLEEIRRIADRISILRDGVMVATRPADSLSHDEMVRLMVGRELKTRPERKLRPAGPVALEVRKLRRMPMVKEVSFTARKGEILGFAGLMGSGRTETMRAIFGADLRDSGEIFLHNAKRPAKLNSPQDAVRQGIALLTEDRKEQGLLLQLGLRPNITLPSIRRFSSAFGWLQRRSEAEAASRWIHRLAVRCRDAEQQVSSLSGGNQQKVVIAKWLLRDCDILIFDEPTRGIDVGSKFEIHRLLDDLASKGQAIIVVSSDLPELMSICDRIAVMSAGRLAAVYQRGEWTEDKIMSAAFSGHLDEPNL